MQIRFFSTELRERERGIPKTNLGYAPIRNIAMNVREALVF